MGRIVENLWDCPYCESKGIRGGITACPNCGRARTKETKFYLPDQITSYVETPIEKGPDWMCPYCDSYNRYSATHCSQCGAAKGKHKTYFDILQERGVKPDLKKPSNDTTSSDDTYTNSAEYEPSMTAHEPRRSHKSYTSSAEHFDTYHDTTDNAFETHYTPPSTSRYRTSIKETINNHHRLFSIIGGILLGTLIVCLCIGIFIPKTKALTIQQTAWTRSIEIEKNRLVEESDWSVPSDAVEVIKSQREIHHYDKVIDHYETVTEQKSRQVFDGYDISYSYRDLGNGYSEQIENRTPRYRTEYYTETHQEPVYRNNPVYRTKYYYTVWRYVYDHTETASGNSDTIGATVPNWPTYRLIGDQREGRRLETYTVTAADKKGNVKTYDVGYDVWVQLKPNQTYNTKVSFGRITEIITN